MKVLFVGVYRDGTGWGNAALNYILALDAAGVDVVPRAIKLNNVQAEVPERIIELEQKSERGCNVTIQYVLPHQLDYDGNFDLNVCIYSTETSNFRRSGWSSFINRMDEAWVNNSQMVRSSIESHVTIPIRMIPLCCDTTRYEQDYEPFDLAIEEDKFVFYTIGEITKRKNLPALLKAFHTEFRNNENVELVIKGSYPGRSPADSKRGLQHQTLSIKQDLKLFDDPELYTPEVLITNRLTEEEVMRLHARCDCFVSSSYGESWCMPAFDAMAMGNTPICSRIGGMEDYLGQGGGWLVKGRLEPASGSFDTFPYLYVAHENWFSIDVLELMKTMRSAYELSTDTREVMAEVGMERAYDYSLFNVGDLMRKSLEESLAGSRPQPTASTVSQSLKGLV